MIIYSSYLCTESAPSCTSNIRMKMISVNTGVCENYVPEERDRKILKLKKLSSERYIRDKWPAICPGLSLLSPLPPHPSVHSMLFPVTQASYPFPPNGKSLLNSPVSLNIHPWESSESHSQKLVPLSLVLLPFVQSSISAITSLYEILSGHICVLRKQ